jgi:EAL domain-containing protein (putative c-di-GMP-specific phosphodiesterase class I)/BarA-like signal transduction histidine kinase
MDALRQAAPAFSIPADLGPEQVEFFEPHASDPAPAPVPVPRAALGQKAATGQILVVEDESVIARAYSRTLKLHGLEPVWVADAASALSELRSNHYDVVISDIMLPDHSGLDLLRHVRNCDPDLPLVLVTGMPDLETAIDAVALGAFRYLVKPVSNDRLIGCITQARRSREVARLREEALANNQNRTDSWEAKLSEAFERALEPLLIAYQPIIRWPSRQIYGYQALVRSDEPSLALPSALLSAAEYLGRSQELCRAVRKSVAKTALGLSGGAVVLVKTRATDLLDNDLYSRSSPLGAVATRVALEVTEQASDLAAAGLEGRVRQLKAMGYRIAVTAPAAKTFDARALEVWQPDIVKIDLGANDEPGTLTTQLEVIEDVVEWSTRRGVPVVAEGVERDAERDVLCALGCDLFHDCLFTQSARRLTGH